MTEPVCETCRRPLAACVCDRVSALPTTRRVLILQHPQEKDALLGTAQILVASLPRAKLAIGLSFRNLGHALDEEGANGKRWAVLFPDKDAPENQVTARDGTRVDPKTLEGIVVLDGTWSKAKTLWWRNPWLTKLNRWSLVPAQPSIYGKLRTEPQRSYVSTLEAAAQALTECGEPPEVEAALRRTFRTLVQRVRDAKLIPDKVPSKRRPPRRAPGPPRT